MIRLTIDHTPVEANEGMTILEAAAAAGISIPSMCWRKGYGNHPSCMICMVKDLSRDHLVPSCAMPVAEGMHILTATDEVRAARKEALELLLSDHAGDCEAPCRMACPAFMDIPLMNRLITAGEFDRALDIVRQEIALPGILGYICPAPCEKACKRKPIDGAVSICLLKRATAQHPGKDNYRLPQQEAPNGKKVAIIGTGPAGLSAAFYLQKAGISCTLFDAAGETGGMMRTAIPESLLPRDVLDAEVDLIRLMGAEFRMNTRVTREVFETVIRPHFDVVIIATGHQEDSPADLFGLQPLPGGAFADRHTLETSLPGVFACGNIIREQRMSVHSAAQGRQAALQAALFLFEPASGPGSRVTGHGLRASFIHRPSSVSILGPLKEPEWKEYLQEALSDGRHEPEKGFTGGFSREEAIREAGRCMRCDCRKPVSCKLRVFSEEYGANRRRFAISAPGEGRRTVSRSMQHDDLVYETEKCIRCGLCIEIAEKHGEKTGMAYIGRGFDVRVAVPFSETVRQALTVAAAECAEACPTGALSFKNREERINP